MSANGGCCQASRHSSRKAAGWARATGMITVAAPRSATSSNDEPLERRAEVAEHLAQHLAVEVLLGVEVAVDDQAADAGRLGDLVHRRLVVAVAEEGRRRGVDQLGPAGLTGQA